MTKNLEVMIEVLNNGGSWRVHMERGRFGKSEVKWDLLDSNGFKVRGFGEFAFRECMPMLVSRNWKKVNNRHEFGAYYSRSYLWRKRKDETRAQWRKVRIIAKGIDTKNPDDMKYILPIREKARYMWVWGV